METIFKRFPLLGEQISNIIDDENLVKLKESSQELSKLLDHQRFYWIRIIKHYKDNFQAFQENRMKIIDKTSIAIVKELAAVTQKYMTFVSFLLGTKNGLLFISVPISLQTLRLFPIVSTLHCTVLSWQIGDAGRTRDESGDERQFHIMVLFERLPCSKENSKSQAYP